MQTYSHTGKRAHEYAARLTIAWSTPRAASLPKYITIGSGCVTSRQPRRRRPTEIGAAELATDVVPFSDITCPLNHARQPHLMYLQAQGAPMAAPSPSAGKAARLQPSRA
jgi:hypothetical protein